MSRLLILILALASGGAAAFIASEGPAPVAAPAAEPAPAAVATTEVLTAATPIARGEAVTPDRLSWQAWPTEAAGAELVIRSAEPGAVEARTGRFATRAIAAGEPIRDAALSEAPTGYLAAMLPPGRRAVAIETSAVSTAGGFILPEDFVDVLHTTNVPVGEGATEIRTRTLLERVRVLAIDQITTESDAGTVLGKTATLELSGPQAELVTAAEATGQLSLSLRPVGDTSASVPAPAADPVPEVTREAGPRSIRIIRPDSVETLQIN